MLILASPLQPRLCISSLLILVEYPAWNRDSVHWPPGGHTLPFRILRRRSDPSQTDGLDPCRYRGVISCYVQ